MGRVVRTIAAAVVAAGVLVVGAPPSQATIHEVSFEIPGGTFDLAALDYPIQEPSTFTGTWNDATGVLTGNFTFAPSVVDFGFLLLPVDTTQSGAATGSLDKATGAMQISTTLEVELDDDNDETTCLVSPIPIVFRTSGAGTPIDFRTGKVDLAAKATSVPAAEDCGPNTDLTNVTLGLPSEEGKALLELQQTAKPPGKPRGVVAEPRDKAAKVSWNPPRNSGGALIVQYQVVSSPGEKTCLTKGALSCVVRNLRNGTKYTFTVRAFNIGGASPFSEPSAPVKPRA